MKTIKTFDTVYQFSIYLFLICLYFSIFIFISFHCKYLLHYIFTIYFFIFTKKKYTKCNYNMQISQQKKKTRKQCKILLIKKNSLLLFLNNSFIIAMLSHLFRSICQLLMTMTATVTVTDGYIYFIFFIIIIF